MTVFVCYSVRRVEAKKLWTHDTKESDRSYVNCLRGNDLERWSSLRKPVIREVAY